MFGINDPGVWMAYLLAFVCLGFSIWFGITRWNRDEKSSDSPESSNPSKSDDA